MSSGATRKILSSPRKEGSESDSSEKEDDLDAAAGFSQNIDTDSLDVPTLKMNEGWKRKLVEIVSRKCTSEKESCQFSG